MKTINYQLSKRLYDEGVRIESDYQWFYWNWSSKKDFLWNDVVNNLGVVNTYKDALHLAPPAPNCEEVIEFLPDRIRNYNLEFPTKNSISYRRIKSEFYIWVWSKRVEQVYNTEGLFLISRKTLLEALEDTLEYLLDNWYLCIEKLKEA